MWPGTDWVVHLIHFFSHAPLLASGIRVVAPQVSLRVGLNTRATWVCQELHDCITGVISPKSIA